MYKVFLGQIIHTKSIDNFVFYVSGFVAVNNNGQIVGIGDDFKAWFASSNIKEKFETIRLTNDQFLMPGFVDAHIHAPQIAQIGLGLDKPLLEWLDTYTFPLESKYKDEEFSAIVYRKVVEMTIRCGTTLASYFGTNYKNSTLILAKEVMRQGQRALVGKVCSNCNSPEYYIESTEESLKSTTEFIKDILNLKSDRILPIITPRFAVSCTKDLLLALGNLAKSHNLHIQSHISENIAEVKFVKKMFSKSYAEIYDNAGLLTPKTILAHGVHLEDDEIVLLRERNTSIAHCPASNTMLHSGLCDVRRLLNNGIKVGLGSDVSGGNAISIQNVIIQTLCVSNHLAFIKLQEIKRSVDKKYKPLNYKEAIYLATLGGASALALDHITGNFKNGKYFDALIIDTNREPLYNFDQHYTYNEKDKKPEEKLLDLVQKFIYAGDDRNIIQVYVSGRRIK